MKINVECRQLKPQRTHWNRELLSQITSRYQYEIRPHKYRESLLFGFKATCLSDKQYSAIIDNDYVAMHWTAGDILHVIVGIQTTQEISKRWKSNFNTLYEQVWRDTGLDSQIYIKEYESPVAQLTIRSTVRHSDSKQIKIDTISKSSRVTLKLELDERICDTDLRTDLMDGQESRDWFGLGTSTWAFKRQLSPQLYGKQLAVRQRDVYFECKIVNGGKIAGQLSFSEDNASIFFGKLKMFMTNLIILNRDRISRDEYVDFAKRMTKHYLIGGHMKSRKIFEDMIDSMLTSQLEPFGSTIKEIWVNPMHYGDNRKAIPRALCEFNQMKIEAAYREGVKPTPVEMAKATGLDRHTCAKHIKQLGISQTLSKTTKTA
jgi:hypothetical protein